MKTSDEKPGRIYVLEQHEQLFVLWQSLNTKYMKVVHLDFHCDMRGLLVDCSRQLAYPAGIVERVDEGNFLAHAILKEKVQSIHWIHDVPGGRKYDVGTVMYMTDMTVQPRRWLMALNRNKGFPIIYRETEFTKWNGLIADEFLDIDWDFFAAKDYLPNTIASRVETFFCKDIKGAPKQISVCYSPRYSHPSREQFEMFVHRLAKRFHAEIIYIPPPLISISHELGNANSLAKYIYKLRYQFKHLHYKTTLWLRKRNIF